MINGTINKISIVIVNWNGKKWLKKCLDSLTHQDYKNYEIILVDNNSQDDSVKFVKKNYSSVIIVESKKNLGFAGGNNLGIKKAQGKYILLLNNDTWVEKNFLSDLFKKYQASNFDVASAIDLPYDGDKKDLYVSKIDLLGHSVFINNDNHRHTREENFFLPGTCLIFEKAFYLITGGLDNNFFMYSEDVDWFWRLLLINKRFGFVKAYFHHYLSGSTSGGKIKYNIFLWRNQNTLQMLLKNYRWHSLLLLLPLYLLQNIFEIIFFLIIIHPKIAWSYTEGWIYNIKYIDRIWNARKLIQKRRLVGDWQIMKKMYKGPGKLYHMYSIFK